MEPFEFTADRVAKYWIEGHTGTAHRDLCVFTPTLLSYADWQTLWLWEPSSTVEYDFGITIPDAWRVGFDKVAPRLCCKDPVVGAFSAMAVTKAEDPDNAMFSSCQLLERHGLVESCGMDATSSTWILTAAGAEALQPVGRCKIFRRACRCQPDVDIMTATPLELVSLLLSDGWTAHVHTRLARGATVPDEPVMETYTVGKPKLYWITPKQTTFGEFYFRALLLAPQHGQPVPHLKAEKVYAALLGVEQPRKKRGQRFVHHDEEPKRARTRTGPRASRHTSEAEPVQPNSASSSSAESSEDSSSSDATHSDDSDGGHVDIFVPNPDEQEIFGPTEEEKEEAPPHHHGLLAESTIIWKTFKFTVVRDKGEDAGWEVQCYRHREPGPKCVRSMRWRQGGGQELTERKLKHWCVEAFNTETRLSHMADVERHPDPVRSLEELDAVVIPAEHLAMCAHLEERRARRPE